MQSLTVAPRSYFTVIALQGNHIYTSGATGTNAAVIRGAMKAEKPDLLTVVLPQSLSKQPPESQELLAEACTQPKSPACPCAHTAILCFSSSAASKCN